jgi:Carboxypeptidase regulatory-like domain
MNDAHKEGTLMLTKQKLIVAVSALVFLVCPVVYGQATGSFLGTVSDKAGAVVSGATVKATSQGTGVSREAKTDDSGHYLIPLLPVAMYTIRVESQGFGAAEQKDVRLQVDEHRELDFSLTPASVTTAVEVSATEVAVETANPSLGQVITSEQVADLPLNGRDFVQLATLMPGTTQETNPNSFFNGGATSEASARGSFSLSVGGSRPQSTDWLLDGNDNNELTAGAIAILPSIDAIQEFKVLTFTYSAQYGTRAGPTVLVTTKSGSDRFHGSLFEFFRNTKLDARSYFAPTREQFNLNQFGGALGGPIRKDKTFFFVDYQAKRQRHGIESTGLVPTGAMMGGDFSLDPLGGTRGVTLYGGAVKFPNLVNPYSGGSFECDGTGTPITPNPDGTQSGGSPCNKIPTGVGGLADPAGQQLIRLYPGNNVPNAQGAGFNFTNAPVRSLNEGEFDVRLDHNFSSKDSVFARFSYDQANSLVPGGSSPTGPTGFAEATPFGSTQNISNHGRNVAISETHIFSSNTVNQINGGFNRIFNFIKSYGYGTCEGNKIGILNANLDSTCNPPAGIPGIVNQSSQYCISCGLTSIQPPSGGYWSLGDRGFAPFQGGTNVFSISDSFDMIRGKHDIRVGGEIRAHQMNVLTNSFQDGFFAIGQQTHDPMADLLMGLYTFGEHDQTFKGATTGRRWKMFRPYVQDDWRATPNLTLNLGFAWALVTPVTEARNRQANFNFSSTCTPKPACNLLVPGVNSDGRVGVKFDKTAFEPRIGLSWKVLGSQTTVLRAGYSIYHDSSWNIGGQGLPNNLPFQASSGLGPFGFPGSCPAPAFPTAPTVQTCAISGGFPVGSGVFTPAAPPDITGFFGTVQSQNLNFKQGMIQQFNLNVEHQLPGNVVLTAGYAGARSSRILVNGLNMNVGSPSACFSSSPNFDPNYHLGCGLSSTAPYQFNYVSNFTDTGAARYDSLQIKAETKSARHGLYMLLGYTYSRTFDSGLPDGLGSNSGATYWPLPGSNKADWGVSGLNLNNQFTASVLYDLPFGKGKQFGGNSSGPVNTVLGGWSINVIERVLSGFPIFVYDSFNQSGVNFLDNFANWNRPDQICDPKSSHPTVSKWFNTQCFVAPPAGQLGTASRTPVYGPDFVNTDFSAVKRIRLSEAMNIDFRAEFFNLFNHAQFNAPGLSSTPGADLASPGSFGVISSTVNNPRVIQFALKLTF